MKILTVVTTIFLPLSLLAGWYGMNFTGMPELTWKYGYPAAIAVSVGIVILSLWTLQKEKVLVGVPYGSGHGRRNADTFPPLCGGKVLAALSERLAVQGIQSIRSHSRRAIASSSSPPQRERIYLSRGFLTS